MPLDQISTARTELIALSEAVAVATVERDEAQRAYDGLAVKGDRLEALVAEHQAELKAMTASPAPDVGVYTDHLLKANRLSQQITELQSEVDLDALRAARVALDAANVNLGALPVRKQSAERRAAVEAARVYLAETYRPALIVQLTAATPVAALVDELRIAGARDPEALSAMRMIIEAIDEAKQTVGVLGGVRAAKSFLAALSVDPRATLFPPEADDVTVVDLPSRAIQPLQNEPHHFNLGPAPEAPGAPPDGYLPNPALTASEPDLAIQGSAARPADSVAPAYLIAANTPRFR